MYQIFVYVPESDLVVVKAAMFEAGGGRVGRYDRCAWQVLGEGQFRPLQDSEPTIGMADQLTRVAEYRLEMVCQADELADVVAAMKQAHPYEEVAYGVVALQSA